MLALVGIYIVLGCFLDQMAILVLTIPIVTPLVEFLGFDLIWFGVIIIVVAELGLVTPPFGLNVFIVSKYANRPVEEVFKGVLPHVGTHMVAIAILLSFPALTLWLPARML
jgi:TRAP-type C4-dicarboxylate transport system permease large subunit